MQVLRFVERVRARADVDVGEVAEEEGCAGIPVPEASMDDEAVYRVVTEEIGKVIGI